MDIPKTGNAGLLLCGDPHGKFDHILDVARERPDVPVVLLGDLEPSAPLNELFKDVWHRTWFIPGNHDTDRLEYAERVWARDIQERNLNGRVVTLDNGIRLAGLGGVFRKAVWYPRKSDSSTPPAYANLAVHARFTPRQDRWQAGPHLRHWSSIYPDTIKALRSLRADVLVTHEAPGYHRNGFCLLDDLARDMGASVVAHGHHHDAIDSSQHWNAQKFASLGVGFRGVTLVDASGNAQILVAGEQSASALRARL